MLRKHLESIHFNKSMQLTLLKYMETFLQKIAPRFEFSGKVDFDEPNHYKV